MDEPVHIDLEANSICSTIGSTAVRNYAETFPLHRQVVQLGGLEMLTTVEHCSEG